MKRQTNGGEVRKDWGVIVNRTSDTSLFLSGRRQEEGGDSRHKYLTFHLSDCTNPNAQEQKSNKHVHMHYRTTAYICKHALFLWKQVPRELRENVLVQTTWLAGCWHIRDGDQKMTSLSRLWAVIVAEPFLYTCKHTQTCACSWKYI